MKVRNSLRSLKQRHRDCRLVRRKGRIYVINKPKEGLKHVKDNTFKLLTIAIILIVLDNLLNKNYHPLFLIKMVQLTTKSILKKHKSWRN